MAQPNVSVYPPQPMQHMQPMQPVQAMPVQAAGNTTVVVQGVAPIRPSSYLGLAIFVTICCNLIFGIIAIVFSVMSSSAADEGDIASARFRSKFSLACSLVGMFTTVIIIIIVIIVVVVAVDDAVNEWEDATNNWWGDVAEGLEDAADDWNDLTDDLADSNCDIWGTCWK